MRAESNSLIYIIVSIIFLIISAVGKANKKTAQNPPMKPSPSTDDDTTSTGLPKEFEEIFGKYFREEPQNIPKAEEKIPPTSEIKPKQNNLAEYESLEVIKEKTENVEVAPIDKPTYILQQETEPEHEFRNEILENIQLEKAIIYAEIINRKYF